MSYTTMSKPDKNQYGLKSHGIPVIIAIAYLVDSIGANMTMLRILTLILAACYVISITAAAIRSVREARAARRSSSAEG